MGTDILGLVIVFGAILVSMTLHEAAHAFTSHWLGDTTAQEHGRLTFNPLAHIDPFTTVILPLMLVAIGAPPFGVAKPVPFDPTRLKYKEFGAAFVGLAGPLTNLILALCAGLLLRFADPHSVLSYILALFTLVNLSFFLFNMIPVPPLDGSRVLYAFAPDFVRRSMEFIESMGIFAIVGFFFLFYMFLRPPFEALLQQIFYLITGSSLGF